MDPKTIQRISTHVYRQFPEMAGVKPKAKMRQSAKSGQASSETPTYLITYQTNASVGNGRSLPRWVRVVATPEGKIIKITTSR